MTLDNILEKIPLIIFAAVTILALGFFWLSIKHFSLMSLLIKIDNRLKESKQEALSLKSDADMIDMKINVFSNKSNVQESINNSLLRIVPCGIITFDSEGEILKSNDEIFKLTGYKASELKGLNFKMLFPESTQLLIVDGMEQYYQNGKKLFWGRNGLDVEVIHKNGDEKTLSLTIEGWPIMGSHLFNAVLFKRCESEKKED